MVRLVRVGAPLPLLAALCTLVFAGPPPVIRDGERFPLLVLPRLDGGRPGSVADFRGRKLVLHVFASW